MKKLITYSFLIARLARSDPRNSFVRNYVSVLPKFYSISSCLRVIHHVLNWIKLDQIVLNMIQIDQTCSNMLKLDQTGPNLFKLD